MSERIGYQSADLALPKRYRRVDVGPLHNIYVLEDPGQPFTSFRLESHGVTMLYMIDGSGAARVDGGDPGDEDRS